MNALRTLLHRLTSDQRGSIAISFAMVFILMVGSTVFAIDMARYNIAQSRIQNALDLTLISVGRNLPQYQIEMDGPDGMALKEDVHNYFYANIPKSFLGATIPQEDISINVWQGTAADDYPDAQYIALEATGKLPMLSAGFFDFAAMDLHASNTAIRRLRNNMEMVLALDNSSTVDVGTQKVEVTEYDNELMDSLIAESKKLTNTVLNAASATAGTGLEDGSGTYIGLVPFTDFVNVRDIGPVENWLRIRPEQQLLISGDDKQPPVWQGCISEPLPTSGTWSEGQLPAQALSPDQKFQPIFTVFGHSYEPREMEKDKEGDAFLVKRDASARPAPEGMDPFYGPDFRAHDASHVHEARTIIMWPYEKNWDYRRDSDGKAQPRYFWTNFATDSTYISGMTGSIKIGTCLYSRVKFLTQNQTDLDTAIENMKRIDRIKIKGTDIDVYGYGGGSTIPVGLLWSWRMLSPAWRGTEGWGSDVLPRDGGHGARKIIVLFANRGNYPLYKHASDGSFTHAFKLSYDYKSNEDGNTETIKVENLNDEFDLSPGSYYFTQCPLNGLRTQDPENFTPKNYDSSKNSPECSFDLTDIGYGEYGGSGLTTESVNDYMVDVCANIKEDPANIEIYTITLGASYSEDTKPLIKGCASSPDKYFDADNVDELSDAFKVIAANVTDFRLIK